jgi:AAA domain, putative AbiEii toxin, Type IV TA system
MKLENSLSLNIHMEGSPSFLLEITRSFTTIVGANATGKSRLLRALRNPLMAKYQDQRQVGFFSASRMGMIDQVRADLTGDYSGNPNYQLSLGGEYQRLRAITSEGASRAMFRLDEQPDLLLVVQTRLQHLFGKLLKMDWNSGSLSPNVVQIRDNLTYGVAREASGLLHIVVLLTAIHDPEIKALVIDEPELSLHPQYQAFIFAELKRVAGDPDTQPGKKLVIIATHSAGMIPLENANDLPGIWFMHDPKLPPKTINDDAGPLSSRKIQQFVKTSLVRRKEVLFSRRPILVEGESDLRILEAIDAKLGFNMLASSAYPIPLQGKGNLSDAMTLFDMMGKTPIAITDLDAIIDSASLPKPVQQNQALREQCEQLGHGELQEFLNRISQDFDRQIGQCWDDVKAVAENQLYWVSANRNAAGEISDLPLTKRRAALSALLNSQEYDVMTWTNGTSWKGLRQRFLTLIETLKCGGWFVMRGVLENHYITPIADTSVLDKIDEAMNEITEIDKTNEEVVRNQYAPMVAALEYAIERTPLSEVKIVQERLAGVLAAVMQNLQAEDTEEYLQQRAQSNNPVVAKLFAFKPYRNEHSFGVQIELNSTILSVSGFPFHVLSDENLTQVVRTRITSKPM